MIHNSDFCLHTYATIRPTGDNKYHVHIVTFAIRY